MYDVLGRIGWYVQRKLLERRCRTKVLVEFWDSQGVVHGKLMDDQRTGSVAYVSPDGVRVVVVKGGPPVSPSAFEERRN